MTLDAVCPKHETPNRLLVFTSAVLERDVFMCDECENEVLTIVYNGALDELTRAT